MFPFVIDPREYHFPIGLDGIHDWVASFLGGHAIVRGTGAGQERNLHLHGRGGTGLPGLLVATSRPDHRQRGAFRSGAVGHKGEGA